MDQHSENELRKLLSEKPETVNARLARIERMLALIAPELLRQQEVGFQHTEVLSRLCRLYELTGNALQRHDEILIVLAPDLAKPPERPPDA
jgi:hypothetical protein